MKVLRDLYWKCRVAAHEGVLDREAQRLKMEARLRMENQAAEDARWDREAEIDVLRKLASMGLGGY